MIRRATPDYALAIATLYHHTVKKINSRDYARTQIEHGQAQRLMRKNGVHAKPIEPLSSMGITAPFAVSHS